MDQIINLLKQAKEAAIRATQIAEAAYKKGCADQIPDGDLTKIAPGRHRLLLKDINQAIDRANTIAATVKIKAEG
jgi:hypothetical protein